MSVNGSFISSDVSSPIEPKPNPTPSVQATLGVNDKGEYVTITPTPSPTRSARPRPTASPSVSNPRPTGIAQGAQFSKKINMQPLGIGAGRSLPYPVGNPGVNVYQPATGGTLQPILTSSPARTRTPSPSVTVRNTTPLFPTAAKATRGRMPYVPGPTPSPSSSNPLLSSSQRQNRTSFKKK